jgi:hypothetical protein
MRTRIEAVLALLLLLTSPVWAQFNSAVQGVVQDPSRAVIPNATVKLLNPGTAHSQETKTNESGYFRFSSLGPGSYDVTVEATGFQSKVLKITITTGQIRDLNIDLEIGQASSTVEVTTEAPPLDTAESRVQLTLPQGKLRDLPLLNNSIFPLMALAPGVTGTNAAGDNFNPEYFSGMSANGRSAYGNTFNVDGLSVTSNISNGTANLAVNPEAIQEVAIETNTFRADQGMGSSIVVSVTTKAGTNDYHGAGNFWFTNQDMRARTSLPYIARYAPFARKDFSGAFGGPVILPKFGEGGKSFYDGKNKTFFFTAFEVLRSSNAATTVETYEAPEFVAFARQNFPGTLGTTLLTANPVDGPIQTNVLRRASDVLGASCGTPATANIPCSLPMIVQGSWTRSPFKNGLQYSFRGDQYIGKNDRFYANFTRTQSDNANFVNRSTVNNASDRFVNAFQANWTHTFSANVLNEVGFSFNKVQGRDGAGAPFRIPTINIQGSTGLGPGFAGTFVQHNYNWREVLTWVKGNHTLKFGGTYFMGDGFADFPNSGNSGAGSRPNFLFVNLLDLVRDQPFSGSHGSYDPLTGTPNAYRFGAEMNSVSAFVQDEWKARPNLTLTLSMRWDDFGNPTGIRGFKIANIFVAPGKTVDEKFPNAAIREVDSPFNGRLNKNFSPRFGFAWSPGASRKTSIRGGVGLYNDWVTLGETIDRVNINPPNFLFPNVGVNLPLKPVFSVGTSDSYPFGFTLPTIPASSLDSKGGIVGIQSGVGGLDPDLTTPKVVNYVVGIERELPGNTVVGINYSGSRTWNALVGTDHNRFPGDLLDGRLDRLNSSFGAMTYIINFNKISYNAMIASVRTDLRSKGTFQASYTLSRATDYFQGGSRSVGFEAAVDPRLLAARPSDALFDIRHRVSASGVYRLPTLFGRYGLARGIFGGWEIGSTAIFQTGRPYSMYTNAPFNPIRDANGVVIGFQPNSGDYNADGFNEDYPNQVAGVAQKFSRDNFLGANAGKAAYKLSDFPRPETGKLGDSPRSYFRQQGFIGVNASVIKNNRLPFLGESGNLQLKFEFFNVLNRVNLMTVQNNLASPTFGMITGQEDPRVIQVGARIAF